MSYVSKANQTHTPMKYLPFHLWINMTLTVTNRQQEHIITQTSQWLHQIWQLSHEYGKLMQLTSGLNQMFRTFQGQRRLWLHSVFFWEFPRRLKFKNHHKIMAVSAGGERRRKWLETERGYKHSQSMHVTKTLNHRCYIAWGTDSITNQTNTTHHVKFLFYSENTSSKFLQSLSTTQLLNYQTTKHQFPDDWNPDNCDLHTSQQDIM